MPEEDFRLKNKSDGKENKAYRSPQIYKALLLTVFYESDFVSCAPAPSCTCKGVCHCEDDCIDACPGDCSVA